MKTKSNMTVKQDNREIKETIRENLVEYFSLFQPDMSFWRDTEKEIKPTAILFGIIVLPLFLLGLVAALVTYPIRKWLNVYYKSP